MGSDTQTARPGDYGTDELKTNNGTHQLSSCLALLVWVCEQVVCRSLDGFIGMDLYRMQIRGDINAVTAFGLFACHNEFRKLRA
jgi:hypothetical protein